MGLGFEGSAVQTTGSACIWFGFRVYQGLGLFRVYRRVWKGSGYLPCRQGFRRAIEPQRIRPKRRRWTNPVDMLPRLNNELHANPNSLPKREYSP